MSQWKKVLISGSHFSVNNLKISDVGPADQNDSFLFNSPNGKGFKNSSIKLSSNLLTASFEDGTFDGNFSGEGGSLNNITATPNYSLNRGAGIRFHGTTGGLGTAFNGSSNVYVTPFVKGAQQGTAYTNVDAATQTDIGTVGGSDGFNSGLEGGVYFSLFGGSANASLALATESLAGNGLHFPDISSTGFNKLAVQLDTSAYGDVSFDLDGNGLSLSPSIAGSGFGFFLGSLILDFASNSGLTIQGFPNGTEAAKLSLKDSFAGNGLEYTGGAGTDHSEIQIDPDLVVTSSHEITLRGRGPNYSGFTNTIGTGNTGIIGIAVNGGSNSYTNNKTDQFIDNPEFEFDLRKEWGTDNDAGGSVTFNNSVTIGGNLTIVSSSNVSNISAANFATSDKFVLINSKSGADTNNADIFEQDGGIIVATEVNNGQYSGSAIFFSSASNANQRNAWGLIPETAAIPWDITSIPGKSAGNGGYEDTNLTLISTVKIANAGAAGPQNNDSFVIDMGFEKRGNFFIDDTPDPAGAESNVWIYVDDPDF